MAAPTGFEWSTRGGDPDNPIPSSTFPSIGMGHVLSYNIVPVDSPARLENHRTSFASVLAKRNSSTYAIEHSSTKAHNQNNVKSHETDTYQIEREHQTNAATGYTVKSARYNSLVEKLKTPSAAKKALATWQKQGNEGLPPQHMTFSSPAVRKVQGQPHLCIECTLDEAYPNFHLQCIFQFLDHTETLDSKRKEVRLTFATIETNENIWIVALEQRGRNDASIKEVVGETEYARLDNAAISARERGQPRDAATGYSVSKKIMIPDTYDLSWLRCETEGLYRVNLYIPETPPGP